MLALRVASLADPAVNKGDVTMNTAMASRSTERGHEGSWYLQRARMLPARDEGRLCDLMRVVGLHDAALDGDETDLAIALWRVKAGATLFHEGAAGDTVYVVRSGSLKCVRTSEDGYEQVLSIAQAGELLGFEAVHCGHVPVSAIALEETVVYALPLCELRQLRQRSPALDDALQFALSRQLARAGDMAWLMAAVAAEVRLARFLLWLSARRSDAGQSAHRLRLHMGRRDIASLLGVAHETVSRSFTALADWGHIRVENRDVEILDFAALRARARCTRGATEAPAQVASGPLADAGVALAARACAKPQARTAWYSGLGSTRSREV